MNYPANPRTGAPMTPETLNEASQGRLPGLIGLEFTALDLEASAVHARLDVRDELLAPNGYLHAATVVALADTACGYGAIAFRPEGANAFTTIEIKTNFLGTAREGSIAVVARKVHGGRTTQVWDADVTDETTGKPIALFRCTQMMLYPAAGA